MKAKPMKVIVISSGMATITKVEIRNTGIQEVEKKSDEQDS
jgi:hypothetical protein